MVKGWNELSIEKYRKINALPEDEDWQWNVLAILNDTTVEDILSRPLNDAMELSRDLHRWIQDKPIIHPAKRTYTLNGKKYRFQGDMDKITTAQYIDFYNCEREIPEHLAEQIAIFFIPEDAKGYNEGYDLSDVVNDIEKYLDVEEAYSVCDFFISQFQVLQARVLRKARKALKQARKEGIQTEAAERFLNEYRRSVGLK